MDIRAIVGGAIGLLIAAIVLTTYTWQIDVVEYYSTDIPYTYEQQLVRTQQVSEVPWFWNKVTQVQYQITNLDSKDGIFTLNFLFDNGIDTSAKTKKLEIFAGTTEAITINSPIHGVSKVSLNVVPPNTQVTQQRTVKKTVNAWNYVPGLKFLLGK
jgi:NADH:ubiquinone oxidoreductase subunit